MELQVQRAPIPPKGIPGDSILLPSDSESGDRSFKLLSPAALGSALLVLVFLFVTIGSGLTVFSPSTVHAGPRLSPPNSVYWFGTDPLGRDLFSRVVHGFHISLWISLAASIIATVPGILLGLFSGYYRGWVDLLFSRLIDVLLSLPGLLLAIVLIARLGASMQTLILAMGLTGIPAFYRITRNETLSMTMQPFVEAGRSIGLSDIQLIFRYILPNIFSTLLSIISMRMGTFLLMGSGLSFIGLGVKPPQAELGALLALGKEYYLTDWWLVVFPGLSILVTVLGLNLFGEGLRDRRG